MKYFLIALALVATLFTSVACAADGQTAKAGKYAVALTTQPAAPTVGENHVTFSVKDGDKPVTGAGVSVHVEMADHSMPADVKATPGTQDGQYVATVNLGMAGQWSLTADVQGMAGMAMQGDGKATFSVTAQQVGTDSASAPATSPTIPTQPATPASLPWPLIIGVVAVVGIVVVVVIVRGRAKQTPGA
jgi:hypothetical protein